MEDALSANPYAPPGATLDPTPATEAPVRPRVVPALDLRLLAVLAATSIVLALLKPGILPDPVRSGQSGLLFLMQMTLMPLAALLIDAFRGAWRRFWLLLSPAVLILLWLALAAFPQTQESPGTMQVFLGLAMTVFGLAALGLAADIGRRHRATGTVSGVRVSAGAAGMLLGTALAPALAGLSLAGTAVTLAAGLAAYAGFAAVALAAVPPLPDDSPGIGRAGRTMIASRAFWLTGLLLFLLAFTSYGVVSHLMAREEAFMKVSWFGSRTAQGAILLAGLVYLVFCRRCSLRRLLLGAVGSVAAAVALTFAMLESPASWMVEARAALIGISAIPLLDLSLRVVPPGLGVLGLTILEVAKSAGIMLGVALGANLGLPPAAAAALCLGMLLAGLVAVSRLPRALVEEADRYTLRRAQSFP